jgi:hypothetical protein
MRPGQSGAAILETVDASPTAISQVLPQRWAPVINEVYVADPLDCPDYDWPIGIPTSVDLASAGEKNLRLLLIWPASRSLPTTHGGIARQGSIYERCTPFFLASHELGDSFRTPNPNTRFDLSLTPDAGCSAPGELYQSFLIIAYQKREYAP